MTASPTTSTTAPPTPAPTFEVVGGQTTTAPPTPTAPTAPTFEIIGGPPTAAAISALAALLLAEVRDEWEEQAGELADSTEF